MQRTSFLRDRVKLALLLALLLCTKNAWHATINDFLDPFFYFIDRKLLLQFFDGFFHTKMTKLVRSPYYLVAHTCGHDKKLLLALLLEDEPVV